MVSLDPTDFNIVCAVLGIYVSAYGLVSYPIRERWYLSETLISFLLGVLAGPVLNILRPLSLAQGKPENVESITYYFSHLVLAVQLTIAGIQLPQRFLVKEWKTLTVLLLPALTAMWLCSSLLIWLLVPDLEFLHALAIGACVSPTDPVLSGSIVKGKFADKNIPLDLRRIIIAEAGANDGLGYPFLFIPLFLYLYSSSRTQSQPQIALLALERWLGETVFYVVVLGVLLGAAIGWIAKVLIQAADSRRHIDRESLMIFSVSVALLVLGTCSFLNSDDVLACFIAGNSLTFDGWFRVQTMEDTLQPSVDLILNMAMFLWLGAACPWSSFIDGSVMPTYRLFLLGALVLLLRRPPVIFLLRRFIPQISGNRDAMFMGFFGPIGISAIFYCYLASEFLQSFADVQPGAVRLQAQLKVIVWFLMTSSIIVHGLSVPLAKLFNSFIQSAFRPSSKDTQPLRI